jgi:hypothetical protein
MHGDKAPGGERAKGPKNAIQTGIAGMFRLSAKLKCNPLLLFRGRNVRNKLHKVSLYIPV